MTTSREIKVSLLTVMNWSYEEQNRQLERLGESLPQATTRPLGGKKYENEHKNSHVNPYVTEVTFS
jgi:hypothetical protein